VSISRSACQAVLLAPPRRSSRRARYDAPGGADDAEDALVELAGEAGFDSGRSYIRSSGAARSWPWLKSWCCERR
jgi:hypothetical protein